MKMRNKTEIFEELLEAYYRAQYHVVLNTTTDFSEFDELDKEIEEYKKRYEEAKD